MAKAKKSKRTLAEQLIDAAIIWHAATVLNDQCEVDTSADRQLRRAATRYLKDREAEHE